MVFSEMGIGRQDPRDKDEADVISSVVERAANAGLKVRERVENVIIPNMQEMGSYGERWLNGLQNDFYTLVDNPQDEVGGGNYADWTSDEIRELYSVLYGEAMDDE